jgi:hypothetical protein
MQKKFGEIDPCLTLYGNIFIITVYKKATRTMLTTNNRGNLYANVYFSGSLYLAILILVAR